MGDLYLNSILPHVTELPTKATDGTIKKSTAATQDKDTSDWYMEWRYNLSESVYPAVNSE